MKRSLFALACWLLAPAALAILDTNNNGVSDLWERDFNNGSLFDESFDPQADPDRDGWTNEQEAAAGTNPLDPNPPEGTIRPEIIHTPAVWGEDNGVPYIDTPEAVTVTWPTISGKRYRLLVSPDLSQGSWIEVPDSDFIGNGNIPEFHFTTAESDKLFWRVAVEDADSDGDGLTDHEEHLAGTNPYLTDSDGDTIPDLDEIISGSDPAQTDEDGDGVTNSQEIYSGTNYQDGDDYPLHMITAERLGYEKGLTAVPQGGQGWAFGFAIGWTPDETFSFDGDLFDLVHLVQEIEKIEYPEIPGDASDGFLRSMELYAGELSGGRNWLDTSEATIRQNAVWLKEPAQPDLREYHFLNITKKTNYTDANSTPSYEVDPVTIQIQPNEVYSERYEMSHVPEIVANSETGAYSQLLTAEFIPSSNADVSADDHLIHLVLKIGDGSSMAEGSTLEWRIESGPGGPSALAESTLSEGFSTVTLSTSTRKGDIYIVKARIKKLGYDQVELGESSPWLFCPDVKVIAGKPHTFAFTTTKSSYHSDGTDTSEITATIKDQYGNLVEDDTAVGWTVAQCPTPPFVSMDDATVDGIAKAVLKAPLIADDEVVTCSAGDKQDNVTIAVSRVTGSIAGNLNLDLGTGEYSTLTVTAQAADGTPVYWTTSNGDITAQSEIQNGSATSILNPGGGRLGAVVVTASVGDRMFVSEGEFTSSAGLAMGADHPVLIAGETVDGIHTPVYADGNTRQIPFFASTPVRIKGPTNSVIQIDLGASKEISSWVFNTVETGVTPSADGAHPMSLSGGVAIDETQAVTGTGSLLFDGTGSGSIPDGPEFHFDDQMDAMLWMRPTIHAPATLVAKSGSWQIAQLADGRIEASVTTGVVTQTIASPSAAPLNQWTRVGVDFRFNRLQLKIDGQVVAQVATNGTMFVTSNPIVLGTGFTGNLDELSLRSGTGTLATTSGLDSGSSLQLDSNGEGTFTVTSSGTAGARDALHIHATAELASGSGTSGGSFAPMSGSSMSLSVAETIVDFADAVHWDTTYDTVMAFIGGDPQTTQGTISGIAGGLCVVGDAGTCVKNLWRMTAWSEKNPNYLELSLGGLGLLTTTVEWTGAGTVVDGALASLKVLAQRFAGNAEAIRFLTVFIEQIKTAIVGGGEAFTWAKAKFLSKMVTDIPLSTAFKNFLHDDALVNAAVRATEKLGDDAAEAFYQAGRQTFETYGAETAKRFVATFEMLGDEAFDALKNAPAGELSDALEGLAKVANKGIAPFTLTRVLNNSHLYGSAYKRTNLLKDLGELADIPNLKGLEEAISMLKATNAQAKGFRYEIEGAAWLVRNNHNVIELTRRVSVDWKRWFLGSKTGRTDIDVIVEEGGVLLCYQFKRSVEALKSLDMNKAWVKKVLKEFKDEENYSRIRYALPNGVNDLTTSIKGWFEAVGILPDGVKAIPHLD